MSNLKSLFGILKSKTTPVTNFVKDNAIPIAAGGGGLLAGLGLAGLNDVVSFRNEALQNQAQKGYVGSENAIPYINETYGINPNIPSDVVQLSPNMFKEFILDPRHGGMYNPLTGKMIF